MEELFKEYLPYQESLLLKELGFNDKCLGCYTYYVPEFNWKLQLQIANNDYVGTVAAPLLQQAFRWFREQYNLDANISVDVWNSKKSDWRITGGIKGSVVAGANDELYDWEPILEFDTYEEAELACINELINIIKNKIL